MTLRVYAIASDGRVPRVRSVPLRAIGARGIWAIVAPARRTPAINPRNLRHHHQVVAAIAAVSAAVLPARFGAVMDEAELRLILRSRRSAFASSLRHVRGRVQMTMRLFESGRRPSAGVNRRRPVSPTPGREYLLGRAAASSSRHIPAFAEIRDTLDQWIHDERVERAAGITSVYHLIPRRAVNRYRRAAAAAIDAGGQRVVLSGPFPPYAFASW